MEVFVTGLGVVSALGIGVEANFNALKSEQTGVRPNTLLNNLFVETHVGELSKSNNELKALLGIPIENAIPRTALLGIFAAKEALGKTMLNSDFRTGFINGSTVGGMDLTENYFREYFLEENHQNFAVTATHDIGTVSEIIANSLGKFGYVNTISTACSSSANTIMLGARMIKAGLIDRVIVGGTDAISNFTISGFRSLMIYDNNLCTPFDNNRKGLNLGEGAGFLLLENESSIKESKNTVLAKVTGWNNANDAFHQTGTSPDGDRAVKAMQGALKVAELNASQIDYVNAHGTATPTNDQSESNALVRVFGDEKISYSSTKGFTGHTLGASGGIESVFSVLSLQNQCVLPNINWEHKMDGFENIPVTKFAAQEVNHVMSNSFGFGGNSTSLIFSKS